MPEETPPASAADRDQRARLRTLNLVLLAASMVGLVVVAAAAATGRIEELSRSVLLALIFFVLALRSALRLRVLRREDERDPR